MPPSSGLTWAGTPGGPAYLLIRVPLQAILLGWVWWFTVRPTAHEPVRFSCRRTLALAPEQIAAQILEPANWSGFTGYGPLPGVRIATFEVKTPEIVGSRFRVQNTDGSTHVEEIVQWTPCSSLLIISTGSEIGDVENRHDGDLQHAPSRVKLHMSEFSPPFGRIARGIDETWDFERCDGGANVVRTFELHARSALTRPLLLLISMLLKRAVARHLQAMGERERVVSA